MTIVYKLCCNTFPYLINNCYTYCYADYNDFKLLFRFLKEFNAYRRFIVNINSEECKIDDEFIPQFLEGINLLEEAFYFSTTNRFHYWRDLNNAYKKIYSKLNNL